jgi:alpha-ketoglutarate-dependent taurine dioxygenase
VAQRGVIFFRGQNNINNELQKELCKRLNVIGGAPQGNGFYRHSLLAMQGEDPEMGKVDQDRLEKMYWLKADNMPRQSHTFDWHTDSSFEANSPDYTLLKMAELPATGGGRSNASLLTVLQRVNITYHRYPLGLRLRTL